LHLGATMAEDVRGEGGENPKWIIEVQFSWLW